MHQPLQPEYPFHRTAENLQAASKLLPCHSRFYFGMELSSFLSLNIQKQGGKKKAILILINITTRWNPKVQHHSPAHRPLLSLWWSLMKSELDLNVFHFHQHFVYSSYFNHHKSEQTCIPSHLGVPWMSFFSLSLLRLWTRRLAILYSNNLASSPNSPLVLNLNWEKTL